MANIGGSQGEIIVDPTVVYDQYAANAPITEFPPNIIPPAGAITSLNGAVGPVVNLDGGTTGYTFTPAGNPITMSGAAKAIQTTTPTTLTIGAIADGDFLVRSGTTVAGSTGPGWTTYVPTITSGTGTFTTIGAKTARSVTLGKTVTFEITIPITTNGTAATSVIATLPATAAAFAYVVPGIATVGGKMLSGHIAVSGSTVVIRFYDNTYPGVDGETIIVSGVYEKA